MKNDFIYLCDHFGQPDYVIGLNPLNTYVQWEDLQSMLDDMNKMHLHSVFGSKWKLKRKKKHRYKMILAPEIDSRNTKADQHQFLHTHGYLWVENPMLIDSFTNGDYETIVRKRMRKKYPDRGRDTVVSKFWIEKYDRSRKVPGCEYATKNFGSDFTNGDTYVF